MIIGTQHWVRDRGVAMVHWDVKLYGADSGGCIDKWAQIIYVSENPQLE